MRARTVTLATELPARRQAVITGDILHFRRGVDQSGTALDSRTGRSEVVTAIRSSCVFPVHDSNGKQKDYSIQMPLGYHLGLR
jgi:hypothetical protein